MSPRKKAEAQPEQQQAAEPKQEPKVLTMAPAVQSPASPLAIQAPPSPDEVLEIAANQIKIRKGYVKLVASSLRPEDVLVFGEEVYLPAKPCQDILSWARIRVKPHWPVQEYRYNSPDGDFLEFVITATIMDTGGREVDVMGNRSTRDEFFGIAGKVYPCPQCGTACEWKKVNPNDQRDSTVCPTHGKVWVKRENVVPHFLPLHDVDIPSVRSAAVTNLWNKALKAIGLMPTLQDLGEAGMDINKVKRVDFKGEQKKSPAHTVPPKQPSPTPTQGTASPSSPQSQPKPSAAPQAGPPKANIPDKAIAGTLDEIKPGTTVPKDKTTGKPSGAQGRPFLGLVVSGARLTCFDNREMAIDTRGGKKKVFDLLMEALGGWVVLRVKKAGQYDNVTGFERIGDLEWDEEGIPVLRRQPAQREPGEYEPTDADLPPGLFPPPEEKW